MSVVSGSALDAPAAITSAPGTAYADTSPSPASADMHSVNVSLASSGDSALTVIETCTT
jgi:hypothetical protein